MVETVRDVASAMSEKRSELSDFSSEESDEGTIQRATRLLHLACGRGNAGEPIKTSIARAALAAGFTFTRARDIWYGDARRIDASEMAALQRLERQRAERLAAVRREKLSAVEQLAALRARLQARDESFHKPDIEAINYALERMRE